jgi:hypothetical protein
VKRESAAFLAFLWFGLLTLWVEERWAWSLFEIGIFLLAAWRFAWRARLPRCAALLPLAGAAAWPWVQLVCGTASPAETTLAAWNWLTFLLVCALAFDCASRQDARSILRNLAVLGAVLAAIALLGDVSARGNIFWIFRSGYADGVFGPFVNRNQYCAWVELLLPSALYLAAIGGRHRAWYLYAAAIFYSSVIAAGSRAGFLLTTAEAAAAMLFLLRDQRLPRKALLQFAGLAAAAILAAGWHTLQIRVEGGVREAVRLDALHASFQMVRNRPWTGFGLGCWPQIYPRYARLDTGAFVNQAHNDWAQWAAEGGLPFFFCLLVFAIFVCSRAVPSVYGLGIVAFLLHALVDYPMQQRPGLAAWFFAMAGLALAHQKPDAGSRRAADAELRALARN